MLYFDNAATTRMYDECMQEIEKYLLHDYFNPSALYAPSLNVLNDIKSARANVARLMGAKGEEIIFTASGSESDNCAMFCAVKQKKGKIIISNVEHSAIYQCANELKVRGYEVLFAPTDKYGRVITSEFEKLIDENVVLVSIIHVCNETGALNDIKKLVSITKTHSPRAIFHSDGVQAYGKIKVNVHELGVDLYSVSGHKIHAPKGIGALYIKNGLNLRPIIFGGGQEKGIRSATENVAYIAAFALASRIKAEKLDENYKKMKEIQAQIVEKLGEFNCIVNTDINNSSPYIVSASFKDIRGESLLHCLEKEGVIIGTGSACSAKKSGMRIPLALKLPIEYQQGNIRISPSENVKEEDIDKLFIEMKNAVNELSKYKRV